MISCEAGQLFALGFAIVMPLPLLAQETSEELFRFQVEPLWEDHGIPLAIMGVVVVFAALVLVSTFIRFLPRIMSVVDTLFPQEKPAPPSPAPPAPAGDEIPEEMIAVLAAAVAETLGRRHRIVFARELTPKDWAWSHQGRWQIHTSHGTH